MDNTADSTQRQLRSVGLRATPARRALLQLLQHQARPLDVQMIGRNLSAQADQATIYRILNLLVAAGLVHEVRLRAGVVHYEIASGPHHHHVVCERCGHVEDVNECRVPLLPVTSSFAEVTRHSLEFSGVCKNCVRSKKKIAR